MKSTLGKIVALLAVAAVPSVGAADCTTAPQPLTFWFGHWDVYAEGKLDGHNFIERTLDGCAVIEHWDDVSGMHGISLFYFDSRAQLWKQVWITDHALQPGGMKEKQLISATPDEVRFQGTVWITAQRSVLDRATLRKLDADEVSQVIETSSDGGRTWRRSYDAVYRRKAP
jgi:hypothetical protein